jgi:hypothetical protein
MIIRSRRERGDFQGGRALMFMRLCDVVSPEDSRLSARSFNVERRPRHGEGKHGVALAGVPRPRVYVSRPRNT